MFRDPQEIKYLQEGISPIFRNNRGSVTSLVDGLRSGAVNPNQVEPIRVFRTPKTRFTTWRRGEGFIGAIATATSHPDLGSVRPADPMDLSNLARMIEAKGSGISKPMRVMILQTLRSSA